MPHATMVETPSVITTCADALQGLLGKIAELRPDPGFDNAVTEAEMKDELDLLFGRSKDEPGKLRGLSSVGLDVAFKRVLYGILAQNTIQQSGFSQVWHLLDIANMLSYREQSEPSLTMGLAEELFESQTTEGCRTVFEYLEMRQDIMFKKSWKDKQQITLRVCNELLRRFSRADNSIFCGRIFIYLFQVFPLGDRSSVNLRGTFHTANKTVWDQTLVSIQNGEDTDIDGAEQSTSNGNTSTQITITPADQEMGKAKEPGKEILDLDTLYPIFWSLQDYFSNPKLLFEATHLTLFKAGLEAVLAKFHEIQKSNHTRPASTSESVAGSKSNNKRKWTQLDTDSSEGLATFNPKYLTSRDLFDLEISSLTFRRHVLVQALILLEFLLFQTSSGREKQNIPIPDPSNPGKFLRPNTSAVYSFELSEPEAKWASSRKTEIAKYLSQGPQGKTYCNMIATILSRDKNWVVWKSHNCLEFVLPPISPQKFLDAQKSAIKAATAPRIKANAMGSFDISFLHDPDAAKVLSKLRDPARTTYPPPLSKYEDQLIDIDFDLTALDHQTAQPENEAIDDGEAEESSSRAYKKKKLTDMRDSLRWRALRIGIRRGRLKWFDRVDGENGRMDALFRNEALEVEVEGKQEEEEEEEDAKVEDGENDGKNDGEKGENGNGEKDGDGDVDMDGEKDIGAGVDGSGDVEREGDVENEQKDGEIAVNEEVTGDRVDQVNDSNGDVIATGPEVVADADTGMDDIKGEPIPVFEGDDS